MRRKELEKSNPRYDDPPGTPFFVEPLHADLKNQPPSIILFPQINLDAPPFVCSGTSFIHAMIVFASLRPQNALKPEICWEKTREEKVGLHHADTETDSIVQPTPK